MRFKSLNYSHTDYFDDIHEIKFIPVWCESSGMDPEGLYTIEVWCGMDDGSINIVLMDGETNETEFLTDEEERFTLNEYVKLKEAEQ